MNIKVVREKEAYQTATLWLVFFCYSICMALIFQSLIVPYFLSPDTGKLLAADAVVFDELAWTMAQNIQAHGWGELKWFGSALASGNVIILAALYAVFGHDPSLVIPINAAIHACGGILIFSLAKVLAPTKQTGMYAGVIAGTIFIIFPSALNWYGQVHKDGYAIMGTLLILLMWVKALDKSTAKMSWATMLVASIVGMFFVGFVRPYGLTLLLVVGGGILLIVLFLELKKFPILSMKKIIFFVTTILVLLFAVLIMKNGPSSLVADSESGFKVTSSDGNEWHWQDSEWIPNRIENYISSAARVRAGLIMQGQKINAQSIMDPEVTPQNITEVIQYLPRAYQLAAMAPFPSSWGESMSLVRLLAAGEMFIYYLCLPGLFLLLLYNRTPKVWVTFYFASTFLVISGFTIANLGSLYRVRYAYILILLMLGVLGWVTLLERKKVLEKLTSFLKSAATLPAELDKPNKHIKHDRKKAVASGTYVVLLTLIGFIGFFYRDILMAHTFGLGPELDGFFVSLLIPMTVVTIVCIPLGAAFTPIFITSVETNGPEFTQKVISKLSAIILVGLAITSTALYFLLPQIVLHAETQNPEQIQRLVLFALPLLFFSGTVILGNTILNAMGKVVVTGIAQLVVPIIAIGVIVLFGNSKGVEAGIVGMVIGQLVNLVLLEISLHKVGYSVLPSFSGRVQFSISQLTNQYVPLAVSAFFVSIALLVNTLMAMSIPDGGVSVFNLGNKVVLLVTGLIGAAISTVMLPYFSTLIVKSGVELARKELSIFLLFLTFISTPVSIGLFIWAEPVVNLIFEGGKVQGDDLGMVVRVMQYAVVQIPFFACNILLLKYATATKHVLAILIVAIMGLTINVAASLFFMGHMGVAGIALGASLSMVIATVFLVLLLMRYHYISLIDGTVLFLNWLLFITLLMSLHFKSESGVVVTTMTYLILLIGYGKTVYKERALSKQVQIES